MLLMSEAGPKSMTVPYLDPCKQFRHYMQYPQLWRVHAHRGGCGAGKYEDWDWSDDRLADAATSRARRASCPIEASIC